MGGTCKYFILLLLAFLTETTLVSSEVTITPYPNATFKINDLVTLNCSLDNSAKNYTALEWYLNDELISDHEATIDISHDSKSSRLELLGAIEYSLASVTCVAGGSPAVSNRSTLLILKRDIDKCIVDTKDSNNICFICEMTNEIEILKLLYRLQFTKTNEIIHQENATTTIGKKEFNRCIQVPTFGSYKFTIYVLDSFSTATLNNPSYVIDDITVESAINPEENGTTSSPQDDDNDTNLLLSLQTWEYRFFVYVGAGLIVFAFILLLLGITVCVIIGIRRNCSATDDDGVLEPFELKTIAHQAGVTGRKKHSSKRKSASSSFKKNNKATRKKNSKSTAKQADPHINTARYQSNEKKHTPVLSVVVEQNEDNLSVESIYDRLYDEIDQHQDRDTFNAHVEC